MGVRARIAEYVLSGGDATPNPGCFSQRVRNAQKVLEIDGIVN